MEQLIAKTALLDCGLSDSNALLVMGRSASFEWYEDGYVGVCTQTESLMPFGLGRPKTVWLGYLVPEFAEILYPAIRSEVQFRVRIVEVSPSYISESGQTEIYVSIWGFPDALRRSGLVYASVDLRQAN
jgi:hypothetical protein